MCLLCGHIAAPHTLLFPTPKLSLLFPTPEIFPLLWLAQVGLKKYSKVNATTFGLNEGKKKIVVLRTSGAILGESPSIVHLVASNFFLSMQSMKHWHLLHA